MLHNHNQVWTAFLEFGEYILFRLYELPLIWQMCNILYYDVLDIPLPELESTRSLKITFENATNHEVSFFFIFCATSIFLIMFMRLFLLSDVVSHYAVTKK